MVMCGALATCGDGSSSAQRSWTTLSATERRARSAAIAAATRRVEDRRKLAQAQAAQQRAAAARRKDRRLFIMSDSVVLGAKDALPKALPTWKVNLDGKESRFLEAGLDVLKARRSEIGRIAVIQIGNNYGGDPTIFRGQIDQAMKILAGVQWVVFLTVFEYRGQQAEVNNELRAAATRYPNLRIADWNAFERAHLGHTSRDGLHLKPSGALLMAGFIASFVNTLPS
jgi:hypothetical protein